MNPFDDIFDYDRDGKLNSQESADRDFADFMAFQHLSNNNSSSQGSGTGSPGCYIATCVYGTYDCPQLWTLRRFRDTVLARSVLGRAFIRCYYTVSPTMVRLLGDKTWFRGIWRRWLDQFVAALLLRGMDDKPYRDME